MKEPKQVYAGRHQGADSDPRAVAVYFGISILFHLIFIGGLVFMPDLTPRSRFSAGVVNVNLVALPGKPPGEDSGPQTAAEPKPAPRKVPKAKITEIAPPPKAEAVPEKAKKAVSLAPKPKEKKSLKKETINRSRVIENEVDRLKKKVDKSESDPVKAAIDKLKKKVEAVESANPQGYPLKDATESKDGSGGSGQAGGGGGTGGGGARTIEAIRIYQAEIQYQIQKNWAFSQQLAGDSGQLEAVLAIKILRSGEIEDIWFDKKSGNSYLDDSAYKAIVKSNPLPPLPKDYAGSFYKIGLIFGPKGLK
jgi:colicin import membrane protein